MILQLHWSLPHSGNRPKILDFLHQAFFYTEGKYGLGMRLNEVHKAPPTGVVPSLSISIFIKAMHKFVLVLNSSLSTTSSSLVACPRQKR